MKKTYEKPAFAKVGALSKATAGKDFCNTSYGFEYLCDELNELEEKD